LASTDGATWQYGVGPVGALSDVNAGGPRVVAVGANGLIAVGDK
jgi:hypothetical protein